MTSTIEYVETRTTDDKGAAAHIVLVPRGVRKTHTPQSWILTARVEGIAVTALCGYVWVPQRDPKPLPVCGECLEIFQNDPQGHGDRGDLPDD